MARFARGPIFAWMGGEAAGDPHTSETEYTMELNRPFIYAVRDQEGEVLFIGVCMDPA